VIIDHFRYLGPGQSSIGWIFSAFGAIAIAIGLWRKWQIRFVLIGGEVAFLIDALLHVPSFYLIPVQVICMGVGIYFDQRQASKKWTRRKQLAAIGQAASTVVVCVIYTIFMITMFRRDITLTTKGLIDTELQTATQTQRIPIILPKVGMRASVRPSRASAFEDWLIGSSEQWLLKNSNPTAYSQAEINAGITPEISLSQSDLFIDSSGHLLNGSDIALLITKWADIKPEFPNN